MRFLADMEFFLEVAKLQNFGRAAEALGITAPTLSRRIAALERGLGVVLIRRTTRSFTLTPSGQKLFEYVERIVGEAAQARAALKADLTKVAGHLRVGAPSDLASTILAPVFARYCRENPAVSVDILSTQGQPDLIRDRLDVAFVVAHQARLHDSTHAMHSIGAFSRMLYASKAYLKARGAPGSPQELTDHACIRHVSGSAEKQWELQRGRRTQTVVVKGVCACSSVIVSAQAARGHLGIAMLPQHLATHPTFGAGLTRVLPEWEGTRADIFAVTGDRVVQAKVREVIRIARLKFTKRLAQLESVESH